MRIVIFSGGTGPIALQEGIYHAFERRLDGIETKVVVNAYDNGLSTGIVRRVMSGKILGPSDVRKNQSTRLRLLDPQSPWLSFLDHRFTADASLARSHCETQVRLLLRELEAKGRNTRGCEVALESVDAFFSRDMALKVTYNDFSIANIIYAGLAAKSSYSLRCAATIMSAAIGIPDNVLLNDDVSLFLGAVTRSGRKLSDEGAIVSWANETDPIIDTSFVDADGRDAIPTLCLEAWQAILSADLIILSSGTQWSSLIPTYASVGFTTAIRDSNARIVMVMNRAPDKDALGQTASDLIDVLVPRYFDPGRLHVLVDKNSHPDLREVRTSCLPKISSLSQVDLSSPADPPDKHNPTRLAHAIGRVFFNEYLNSDAFVFDYDDTLVGRNDEYPASSKFNVHGIRRLNRLTAVAICTGNTIRALQLGGGQRGTTMQLTQKPLLVFADGGVNVYSCDAHSTPASCGSDAKEVSCVAPNALLTASDGADVRGIIASLRRAGIAPAKIENRGDAVIAIRPIDPDQRPAVASLARSLVQGRGLEVREVGRTTVEIRRPSLSKIPALKYLWSTTPSLLNITYIGDECEGGNDHDIAALANEHSGLKCLRVNGPAHTAFFIATLIACLEDNGKY